MAGASGLSPPGLLNLEKELVCFICTEVLYQPLTLIDCLHTFCGSCLKEWFSHQYRKATSGRASSSSSSANPYTCPTCRAIVKDARHNATVTTLLDMFLAANPARGRSLEEKRKWRVCTRPAKIYSQRLNGPGDMNVEAGARGKTPKQERDERSKRHARGV